jgi:hypothetical protein
MGLGDHPSVQETESEALPMNLPGYPFYSNAFSSRKVAGLIAREQWKNSV